MGSVRWMLAKDLRILRRSPALSMLLIVYPAAIAVLIGLALSRGPGLPRVAFLNEIPPSRAVITLGSTRIDTTRYERQLFQAIQPVTVSSRAQAIADVRDGSTIAALIIPADLPRLLASAATSAYVQVIYNGDAINQSLVETAIESKLAQANALLAVQLEKVAGSYIDLLLSGGRLNFLGLAFNVLGLRDSAQILDGVLSGLPAHSPLATKLTPVAAFAKIAVNNLASAKAVIGAVGAPIVVHQQTIDGRRTPLDFYAVAIAVTISLMFVCLLLASGTLALEREENTLERLRRGLVSPSALLGEKSLLASVCAVFVGFAMLAGIGIFVPLDWGRAGLWLLALLGGALAFATLGVALGGLVRDVRAASLLALLVSFPLVFLALVPAGSVAVGLYDAIRVVSAVFPFKAALEAVDAAVNRSSPSLWAALGHIALLVLGFGALARLALRR
ncbi:MAG: ABC transporter permease [Solirubrobacteraceae bacterium]|jgi:ABC-2 type transport system permease protein